MEKVVVEFKYNGIDTIIQCKENEKMGDICKRFVTKAQEDKNNLYFVYASNNLKEELTFSQCANKDDIQRKKMTILVNSLNSNNSKKGLVRSKEVICPKCHESALINIKNYKLIIFNCKNKHKNVISLNDYENTQYIDESLIICSICKENNKSNTYKNIFYRCNSCNINLCPLCKTTHEKTHNNIINYEQKNYICSLHNESYNSYCEECKKNLCVFCENEHDKHKVIYHGKILPNKNEIKNKMNIFKDKFDKFKLDIKGKLDILNKISNNIEKNYQLSDDIINPILIMINDWKYI